MKLRLKRILAIDGGGIRGLIPALVLGEIERRTGRKAGELFDLIVGTSTGGILALALVRPDPTGHKPQYSSADLGNLYLQEGNAIFPKTAFSRLRRPFDKKYPATQLQEILRRYFDETKLSAAVTDVLVTSYEIHLRQPWFFRSRRARQDSAYDFTLWEAALATSAAPTYFEPCHLRNPNGDHWYLIDGGTFANNPALCGYVESRTTNPQSDVLLVSLGTGRYVKPLAYDDAKKWGLLGWARPILDVVFDGVSRTTEFQMAQLLPDVESQKRYFRFQTDLAGVDYPMDDCSPASLKTLEALAKEIITQHSQQIEILCEQLMLAS